MAYPLVVLGCAASLPQYPVWSWPNANYFAFVGAIDSLDVRESWLGDSQLWARAQVTEVLCGDLPDTIWLRACCVPRPGMQLPVRANRANLFAVGDRLVASILHTSTGHLGRDEFMPMYVRYFFNPSSVEEQPVYSLTDEDSKGPHRGAGRGQPAFWKIHDRTGRTWIRDDLTLGELSADLTDFYNRRRFWNWQERGFGRSPWHRGPTAAERDALVNHPEARGDPVP